MTSARRLPWWLALLVAAIGLGALYRNALRTGFLSDDYLFLDEARTHSLTESLGRLGALANYYRPLARQLYFAALTPLAHGTPLVFHAVNALAFAAALALLLDLLLAVLPLRGALAGALYFALLPLQRVNLTWISCSQDLFALAFSLAALALFRRRRDGWACLAYLAALASKEVAYPLPVVLAAWAWLPIAPGGSAQRRPAGRALVRRMMPFAIAAALWAAVVLGVRAVQAPVVPPLPWRPGNFLAALVHGAQALLGLDHPAGFLSSLLDNPPALLPLLALGALAWWLPSTAAPPARGTTTLAAFAIVWLVAFALPVGPVVGNWSSYYYTLAAVGGALLVGLWLRDIDRWAWLTLVAGLLWWHAGTSGLRAFGIANRPWGWTSHFTSFSFQRGAALCDSLRLKLRQIEPSPPHGTRFFFAVLPSWAGFQTANGPVIRDLYRDSTLASYFYSQFSESTAADHPCRFLYWDELSFAPLYGGATEPWFQVGTDLLLFDRPAGASHAFRRGLDAGEGHPDHLYWLGWAELWRGRRAQAEAAWQAFGARDDPKGYDASLVAARDALLARDSLSARRHLFASIRAGIGRPEAHGALGELLAPRHLKYALLELKVAAFLNPKDLRARRDLVVGLVTVRADETARRELEGLLSFDPGSARDSAVIAARRKLDERAAIGQEVAKF